MGCKSIDTPFSNVPILSLLHGTRIIGLQIYVKSRPMIRLPRFSLNTS
ncbi:MAG: hypothetical protein JWP57_1492 [Spirosoma sp.]|nr:hypothetical protein [Spirosoma sp.]